jgi:UDP:flavonoid glycosyltransferase YjiC (YdhE family)
MIEAFRSSSWEVILSLSASRDTFSALDPAVLPDCPENVHINQLSANFDVLADVDLFIGQGGQGGVLEAIYHGVPQIVVPASPYHHLVGRRVAELNLGACVPLSELSADCLIPLAARLLEDQSTRKRVRAARDAMRASRSAALAADILEGRMAGQRGR